MRAKSIKGKSITEIQKALRESAADGFKPSLGFVFISVEQDIKAISALLKQRDISVFGVTTAGEFAGGEVAEGSVHDIWQRPMTGLFCYGEFGKSNNGENEFS